MKNLIFVMMAILLINVSYAGEVGEHLKTDCTDGPQHSRHATVSVDDADAAAAKKVNSDGTVINK